ncbi:Rieske 2Fe-2S domain-containing protein [Streptomyces sp. NPDC049040]|uniref:Rieske 2Fe-2S domain-containing protein n=1 Tax=Streptomyces sp. NPDC049040 TaxID=3365593 RepID=UPI003719BCB6
MKKAYPGSALAGLLPDAGGPGRVLAAMGALEGAEALDGVAGSLRRVVRALPLGRCRDVLHGRWLGHPVHPLLVQVPMGAWLSSAVLDLVPGARRQSALLLGVGLAGAGPAALAGWADWAELEKEQARVGLAHAALNTVAISCYAGSLGLRLTGRHRRGRLLALAGLTTVSLSGALGGHLAYRQAAGANHAEAVPRLVAPGWHAIGALTELPVGQPVRRLVDDTAVVVVRQHDDELHVLADRCSHLGGPLSEGEVAGGCVTCPWHGSTFRLADGWNVTGPATAPQPAFDTRVEGGLVQVRLRDGAEPRS